MNKEFVKYEQAIALKELGFDEPCFGYWQGGANIEPTMMCNQGTIYVSDYNTFKNTFPNGESRGMTVISPLYSQAFRWFREKYNLYSEINLDSYKEPYSLKVIIKHLDETNTFVDKEYYPYSNGIGDIDNKKHEEAESDCLDKLIEIIKNK